VGRFFFSPILADVHAEACGPAQQDKQHAVQARVPWLCGPLGLKPFWHGRPRRMRSTGLAGRRPVTVPRGAAPSGRVGVKVVVVVVNVLAGGDGDGLRSGEAFSKLRKAGGCLRLLGGSFLEGGGSLSLPCSGGCVAGSVGLLFDLGGARVRRHLARCGLEGGQARRRARCRSRRDCS
jgi:hypothetical protein